MAGDDRASRAEFLAWALARFERFAGIVDIVTKGGARQKLRLDHPEFGTIQRRYCASRTARDVVCKPRQVGFTTLEQARDIYHFLTVPGARVVATCQSLTGNDPYKLLSNNYRVMFESLQRAGLALKFRTETQGEWTLADRDASLRIVEAGASEKAAVKKGRAGTISRLHLTETAYYEYADDTLNAMLECVPSIEHGSEIVNESTPYGAAGFFYRACMAAAAGEGAYRMHFYRWYEQPEYATALSEGERVEPRDDFERMLCSERGVTPEQLKWYRAKVLEKGPQKTHQEYPTDLDSCFLASGRGFFDGATTGRMLVDVRAKRDACVVPLETRDRGRVVIWRLPTGGEEYVLSGDTSEGGGGDPSAGVVRDRRNGWLCAVVSGQYQPWELAACLAQLGHEYNDATVAVERNNHGHAVLQALVREHQYAMLYEHSDGKLGWPTNPVTRPTMLDALEDAHRRGLWTTPDLATLEQFKDFIINEAGKAEAKRGSHDDLVMAEAICWAVRALPSRRVDWNYIDKANEMANRSWIDGGGGSMW